MNTGRCWEEVDKDRNQQTNAKAIEIVRDMLKYNEDRLDYALKSHNESLWEAQYYKVRTLKEVISALR